MKIVREYLYEKFTEEGDPIQDMGIGLLPKYKEVLGQRYKYVYPEPKDMMRIKDIIRKADGDKVKERKLAATMAKLITDRQKAWRRYLAALKVGGNSWDVTQIFLQKAGELHNIV
jgi:hypothetical protein